MLGSKRKANNVMKKGRSCFLWIIRMSISSKDWSEVMGSQLFMSIELIIAIKIGKICCNRPLGSSKLLPGGVRTSRLTTKRLFSPPLSTNSKCSMEAELQRLCRGSGTSGGNKCPSTNHHLHPHLHLLLNHHLPHLLKSSRL